ncbi:MAG: cytochrome C [Geobacter sp.]|nr:MAG: cytochrome C [Geobacter sp.]
MKLSGSDWLMVAVGLGLVAILSVGVGKGKGKAVPLDERHKPFYLAVKGGQSQPQTEALCATCHGQGSRPLPKNHPPKEQCLICHPMPNK